jgi:hypothetical protein
LDISVPFALSVGTWYIAPTATPITFFEQCLDIISDGIYFHLLHDDNELDVLLASTDDAPVKKVCGEEILIVRVGKAFIGCGKVTSSQQGDSR